MDLLTEAQLEAISVVRLEIEENAGILHQRVVDRLTNKIVIALSERNLI